uniref:Uncharacterized protein n=1 Tax=Parascaris equorum TaxID=6256 RepID=A0A914RRQ0_PAREQ
MRSYCPYTCNQGVPNPEWALVMFMNGTQQVDN